MSSTPKNKLIILGNSKIEVGILPDIGGRIVILRKPGGSNIIKSDEKLWGDTPAQRPELSAFSNWKAYNGHIVWVGPQTEWWRKQDLNKGRKIEMADWPPDPYQCFSSFEVISHTPDSLVMIGPASPVTGIQLTKTISIQDDGQVRFTVAGKNIRRTPVSWDLWLNTRVDGYSSCYVPISPRIPVKIESRIGFTRECAEWEIRDGFFRFVPKKPSKKTSLRSAKAYIYPSNNFMAAFDKSHVLIIRFPFHPKRLIHSSQGLVEFYNETTHNSSDALMELECHSPYQTLKPGQTMETSVEWTLYNYSGKNNPIQHHSFLANLEEPSK
jgi:hypothetical protein